MCWGEATESSELVKGWQSPTTSELAGKHRQEPELHPCQSIGWLKDPAWPDSCPKASLDTMPDVSRPAPAWCFRYAVCLVTPRIKESVFAGTKSCKSRDIRRLFKIDRSMKNPPQKKLEEKNA